jgi:hypothetical protein
MTPSRVADASIAARSRLKGWMAWISRVPGLRRADGGRLVVSLAESTLMRKAAWPVLVPLKLWAAWAVVTATRGKVTRLEHDPVDDTTK